MATTHAKLGTDSINKLLLRLSTPAMLAMFATALYNIIDTIFIGRGVGSMGIAAVAIVLPIVGIINSFCPYGGHRILRLRCFRVLWGLSAMNR
ncbi:MAG: MATE family efflux transporter [Bacteroidales bacterium]|nr:MATE family efflux transporter [Bacteroidales bacterium]